MQHFFAQKDIIFDPKTGLFRVENDFDKALRLEGHGAVYAMVRKALLRNKILASRDCDSVWCIRASSTSFEILKDEEVVKSVETIEALIEEVESI